LKNNVTTRGKNRVYTKNKVRLDKENLCVKIEIFNGQTVQGESELLPILIRENFS